MSRGAQSTAELAHDLREAVSLLLRRLRAEPGPPVAHLMVLSRLSREGPASISDLAAVDRVRPQSMAQTVRDLEDAGLLTRHPDPDDRRRVVLELTQAGVDKLAAARARREDWLTRALEQERDASERRQLRDALALLRRVADA